MRGVVLILRLFFLFLLLVQVGCEQTDEQLPFKAGKYAVYARYAPTKVDILPVTEFVCIGDEQEASEIRVYVSLLDAFDSQVKGPGVFRFELYEYVQRCAEPKGRRLAIWPDIDLTVFSENSKHWRDFLRSYEFDLDFEPQNNQSYVLQVTCLCPNGRRLSGEFVLKYVK